MLYNIFLNINCVYAFSMVEIVIKFNASREPIYFSELDITEQN